MVTFTPSQSVWEFAKLRAICAKHASIFYVPTCQTRADFSLLLANVPANVPTRQRCANYSIWRANVPKACQSFNFVCQKAYHLFNYFSKEFFNFWIFQSCLPFENFKNIWAILENLSRETKNLNFDICQPKTFDIVFNRARGINQTSIRLHFFYKQLGLGPSPQSCFYFQDFQGSKLLCSCLVVVYVCVILQYSQDHTILNPCFNT